MDFLICTAITGSVATIAMDAWSVVRKHVFATALPDYRLVGRWFAHLVRGRLRHESIKSSPAVRGECTIGWIAHYAVGIAFAAILLGVWGLAWVRNPAIAPALLVGIGTVAAPFLILQPAMGAGVAASRTPHPGAARLQSLVTHAVFGLGLYAGGWVARLYYGS
jgi:hypothetical protein